MLISVLHWSAGFGPLLYLLQTASGIPVHGDRGAKFGLGAVAPVAMMVISVRYCSIAELAPLLDEDESGQCRPIKKTQV